MTDPIKTWFRENSTLVYFLIAQAGVLVALGYTFTSYMANLEARVSTLETPALRGMKLRLGS